MKGSGVGASTAKPKSSKKGKESNIPPPQQPNPVLPVGFEFEKFLELPKGIQENIMSRGIKESAVKRPGEQLEFLAHTTPGVVINKDLFLPQEVKIYFVNGTIETKTFNKFSEYKEYFKELFENKEEKNFESIRIIHEYILISISLFRESSAGSIHIHILSSSSSRAIGTLSLNFEHFKKLNDVITISKVLLELDKNYIENLIDIFVGIKWLPLVFKEIKVSNLITFDTPDNIIVKYYNKEGHEVRKLYSQLTSGEKKQLMLLMQHIGKSLKQKPKTTLSHSVRQ